MESCACTVFCVDNSQEAVGSGDYPPTRWSFQKEVVAFLSRAALYVGTGTGRVGRSHPGRDHFAVVTAAGRPRVLIPPTADRSVLYTTSFDCPGSGELAVCTGLKLALLACKRYSPVRVVLLVASCPSTITPTDTQQLQQAFATAGASLQVVSFSPAAPAELHTLVAAINQQHSQSASTAPPSSLLDFPPPDEDLPLWQQLEPLSHLLEPRPGSQQPHTAAQEGTTPSAAPASTTRPQPALRPAARPVQHTGITRLARMLQPRHCRYESLDTLQHLSSDGLMRSWLPSYANVSRIITRQGAGGQPTQCYIQLHRSDAPRWHQVLEVAAGRVTCQAVLQPQQQQPAAQRQQHPAAGDETQQEWPTAAVGVPSSWDEGAVAAAAGSITSSIMDAAVAALDAAPRSDSVASAMDTLLCSSHLSGTSSIGSQARRLMLAPLPEAGTLSLWQSTQHAEVFRLVWSKAADEAAASSASSSQDEIPIGALQLSLSNASTISNIDGADSRVLLVLPHGRSSSSTASGKQHFFWLQQSYEHQGLQGAAALAAQVTALLQHPPHYSPIAAGHMFKAQGRVVQLGPLPVSVLREVLKAGGWEAQNEGGVVNVSLQGGKQRASKAGSSGSATCGSPSGSTAAVSPGSGAGKASKAAGSVASIRTQMRRLSLGSTPLASSPDRPRVRELLHASHKLRRLRERGSTRGELASPVASPSHSHSHRGCGLSCSLPETAALPQREQVQRQAFSADGTPFNEPLDCGSGPASFSGSVSLPCLGAEGGLPAGVVQPEQERCSSEDAAAAAAAEMDPALVTAVPGSISKADSADDSLLFDLD